MIGGKDQVFLHRTFRHCFWIAIGLITVACATQPQAPVSELREQNKDIIGEAIGSGDWQAARIYYEQLLAKTPGDCRAMYHLGYIWGQLEDHAREIRFYEEAVACGYTTDDRLFFNLGMAYGDRGDLERATAVFERAVAVQPDNPDNHFALGLMEQAMGRSERAEHTWQQAVTLDSRHWESRLALARLYLDQSRWDEAREQLDAVEQGEPDNEEAQALRQILASRKALEYER
jgi:tetratricopeptide (TPR) repeat protein